MIRVEYKALVADRVETAITKAVYTRECSTLGAWVLEGFEVFEATVTAHASIMPHSTTPVKSLTNWQIPDTFILSVNLTDQMPT